MVKIFDSLSKSKKKLTNDQLITIYLCGPTVYNYIHIGNARPILVFDVLIRLLDYLKYKVKYVHNITDIDDKIIDKAIKSNTTEREISELYYQAYLNDLRVLGIKTPNYLPKVSDYINENIEFIQDLIDKGFAYKLNGSVYFNIVKFKDYGKFTNSSFEKQIINSRELQEQNKKNVADFVLWKATKTGKVWPSVWGLGRPGWHTECVVFINKFFDKKTITIHGGGVDLKFPHHENERAQFIAENNQEIANIWCHIGHVNVENQKMSKSLSNFILVKDFCQKYHSFILRYLLLNHKHQQPINIDEAIIDEAKTIIKKFSDLIKNWKYLNFICQQQILNQEIYQTDYYNQIIVYLSNNLDLINTFTVLNNICKELNNAIKNKDFSTNNQKFFQTFIFGLSILGFNFNLSDYSEEVKHKIIQWESLKKAKNYNEADNIRIELQKLNIIPE